MQVKVLIFGQLTDITGVTEIQVNDVSDRDQLIAALNNQYPSLADSKYAIAVNKQMINENIALTDNSIIALLPPFSGG